MKITGIVAEYNPFHNGHAYQIKKAREVTGCDYCIAVISGDFVQRGEVAVFSKYLRTKMALLCGADLVLEIPSIFAVSSAEDFAAGAVALLDQLGVVTHLCFGSEMGESERFMETAAILADEPDSFSAKLKEGLSEGLSWPQARVWALEAEGISDLGNFLETPNNLLGVEYCKAIARQNAVMEPLALPRRGVGHDGGAAEGFASASHIRELLINGACADEFLTPESAAICARERAAGRAPVTMANAERAILARLRAMREEDFAPFDGGGEGLYHRLYDAVQRETTIDGILAAAKSKRYAYARLRRLLLAAYLGVTPEDIPQRVPYLRVLACNARGREVLRCMKTTAAAPVLTRSADVRRLDAGAQRLFALTARAEEQYVLAYPDLAAARPGSAWTTDPVIL